MSSTIRKAILRAENDFQNIATTKGYTVPQVRKMWVEQNIQPIREHLASMGYQLESYDPVEVAAQVAAANILEVNKHANRMGKNGAIDFHELENNYFDYLEENFMAQGYDPDFFVGSLLNIAKNLGEKALGKINENRAEKGKKPLLMSKKKWAEVQAKSAQTNTAPVQVIKQMQQLPDLRPGLADLGIYVPNTVQLGANIDTKIEDAQTMRDAETVRQWQLDNQNRAANGLQPLDLPARFSNPLSSRNIANDIQASVTQVKTRQFLNQNLPIIIIAIAALLIFFVARKK